LIYLITENVIVISNKVLLADTNELIRDRDI